MKLKSWFDFKYITPDLIIESFVDEIERFSLLFESTKKPQNCFWGFVLVANSELIIESLVGEIEKIFSFIWIFVTTQDKKSHYFFITPNCYCI